jgi:hypothetical protein
MTKKLVLEKLDIGYYLVIEIWLFKDMGYLKSEVQCLNCNRYI